MTPTTPPKKRTIWKRLLLGLVIIATLFGGYHFWMIFLYEQNLNSILAEIDAEDPNWTWEQMLASRSQLKPEDNGAIELIELLKATTLRESIPWANRNEWAKKYMKLWDVPAMLYSDGFLEEHPNAKLPAVIRELTEPLLKMEPMPQVLNRARDMKRFQVGRMDHTYRQLLMWSLLPDIQGTRNISTLLGYDADLLADRNQPAPAVKSIQGMLGIGRCLSNDPFLISHLVRQAISGLACRQTARMLAQPVTLTSDQLKLLQWEFEREHELTVGMLTKMIRSERAVLDHDLDQLAQGKINFSDIAGTMGVRLKLSTGYVPLDQKLVNLFPELLYGWGNRPGHFKQERASLLKFYTQAVRWSAQPENTLVSSLEQWEKSGPFVTPFLRQFHMMPMNNKRDSRPEFDSLVRTAHAFLANRAKLRAIIAAIACERYRLDTKSWPTSWDQLTPQYLKAAPIDPNTGKPLFLKALPDGLVIYSVGRDQKDDGGEVLPGESPARDVGYRLWNPAQRGINLDEKYNEYLKNIKGEQ
ncbi:MAG: hypothetical protein QM703_28310 [Gemmatales bacterium]